MEYIYKNDEIITSPTKKTAYLKDNIKGEVFHKTYIDYLHYGYSNHYGIEVKPDYIWFTILNEVSRAVLENPNKYRSIFTNSEEKKNVSVPTMDPVVMPINSLLDAVFDLIPEGLKKDNVVLNFSTTTNSAKLAFSTAFLEAASPYYTYSMYMCGYNKIRVLGAVEDYVIMKQAVNNLSSVFNGTTIETYLNRILYLIDDIITNFDNPSFWEVMYYFKECGSGSQEVVQGWFSNFFGSFPSLKFVECFPKHYSSIEYKNLSTQTMYKMEVGLFSSIIEDGYLITDFEFGVNEL